MGCFKSKRYFAKEREWAFMFRIMARMTGWMRRMAFGDLNWSEFGREG